jgi:hypothetical protein
MFADVCGTIKKGVQGMSTSSSNSSAVVAVVVSAYDRAVDIFDLTFPDLTGAQKLKCKKALRDSKDTDMFLKLNDEEKALFIQEVLEV